MVKDHHGNQQCRASRWRAKIRKLGSGKGCFSSLAASSAEELDPQHRVSTDVQRIPESLPAPQCPGPSVTRHTNTVPRAGLLRIPGSWEVLCLLCTGGTAWKWCGVCSEIRVIVHMTEKRYQGSSPLQGNCSLQTFTGINMVQFCFLPPSSLRTTRKTRKCVFPTHLRRQILMSQHELFCTT